MPQFNAPVSPNLLGLPHRPSLSRFLDFWLAHVAWQRLRFTTARTYSSVVVHVIAPVLGKVAIAQLQGADIEKAQLVWQRAGVSQSMRRKAVEVLRSALRHAVALGLCEINAASRSKVPPKSHRTPEWLDAPDARQLLASAHAHPLEAAYALALGLGLRRGEIAGLTWNDVDFANHVVHIRWSRTEFVGGTRLLEPKTAASRRTLALPAFVERSLRDQWRRETSKARKAGATVRPGDPVLTTRTRRPHWTAYLHVELKKRLRNLGLPPLRYHDLRHSAASLMLAEGISPRTVMEMLGHRNLEVTMFVYGARESPPPACRGGRGGPGARGQEGKEIILTFAAFEREIIGERTRDKMGAARRKGKWLGGTAPLGYDVSTSGQRKLVINPAEAEQLRAIFELYLRERSLLRVVQILNARGWRTKSWTSKKGKRREGGLWGKWPLRSILTNVTYIGQVAFKGEIFRGEHEPIIDAETFAKVGVLIAGGRHDVTNRRNSHGFLLRGLIRCANCGSAMTSTVSAPRLKAYRYYVCSEVGARGAKSCPVRTVSAPRIEASVVEQIRAVGRDAALVEETANAIERSRRTEGPALAAEKERLQRLLVAAEAESKQLVASLGDQAGLASRAILERLGDVERQAQQIQKRLPEIDANLAALGQKPVSPEAVANALALFDPAWERLLPRE